MKKSYNTLGGLRVKRVGRVSKDSLLKEIKSALDALTDDFELESFGGANLYIQMYDKNGDRLAIVSDDGAVVSTLNLSEGVVPFSWKDSGFNVQPVKEIEKADRQREAARRSEHERIASIHRAEMQARYEKEQKKKEELSHLRAKICEEFGTDRFHDVASSVGRIISTKAITKYIEEFQIPECGYVLRASMKDRVTGKVSEIRIYDDKFALISTIKS